MPVISAMVPPETPGITSADPIHSPFSDNTPAFLREAGPGLAKNASFQVNGVLLFIVPLFHYSMSEAKTHASKNILYFHLVVEVLISAWAFLCVFFPAMGTNQFDKTASSQIRLVDSLIVFGVLDEVLGMLIADRYHHAPTFNQLIQ